MGDMTLEELDLELSSTSESYIRRKLTTGRYSDAHREYVRAWLEQREAERNDLRAAETRAISERNVFWSKVGAVAALLGSLTAVSAYLAARHW